MKTQFLFLIMIFFLGYWTRGFLSGTEKDLQDSNTAIVRESVASAIEKSKSEKVTNVNLNPGLIPKTEEPHRAPAQILAAASSPMPNDSVLFSDASENEYWCQSSQADFDESTGQCTYKGCFGCASSRVLPPTVENSEPLCTNGARSSIVSVYCCGTKENSPSTPCPDAYHCALVAQEELGKCSKPEE